MPGQRRAEVLYAEVALDRRDRDVADRDDVKALFSWIEENLGGVDILVNSEPVDALAQLVHRDKARTRALHYCEQLAEAIDKLVGDIKRLGPLGWSNNWAENGERLKALQDIVNEHKEAMEVPQ